MVFETSQRLDKYVDWQGDNYMKRKSMDYEFCDYDEAYTREEASDIGWCGKCRNKQCPYNKDLNEKEG